MGTQDQEESFPIKGLRNSLPDQKIGKSEDARATRIFKLINRLASNEIQRYKRAHNLVFPFFVTEDHLKRLSQEIYEAMEEVQTEEPVEFTGLVRFQDLSSQQFDNLSLFLHEAGRSKDPESVYLTWNKFAIDDDGEAISGRVEVSFVTEKRLTTEKAGLETVHQAKIEFVVSGSNRKWVNHLFETLLPHLENTAHSGIMRPLWVFRNPQLVYITALVMGWVALIAESRYMGDITAKDLNQEKVKLLGKITETESIEEKFDLYIQWILTPASSSTKEAIVQFLISITVFGIAYFATMYWLPRLTPSSAIAIGLAQERAAKNIATFKFVIFTVLIGGLIVPIALEIIKWLFS